MSPGSRAAGISIAVDVFNVRPTPGPADRASDDETPDPEPYAPVTRVIVRVVHQDASTTVYQVCAPPERRLHVGTHVALYRPDGAAIGIARRVSAVHAPERHNVTVNLVLQRAAADEPELLLNVSLARGWVGRLPAWVREVWESPARETLPATYAEPQVWKGSRPWWSPVAPARGKPGTDRMNDDVYTDIERAYRTFQILHPGF